jgi:cell division GTPase FtsZ
MWAECPLFTRELTHHALNFLGSRIDPSIDPETAITFGMGVDESLGNVVKVTIILTGIEALPCITG